MYSGMTCVGYCMGSLGIACICLVTKFSPVYFGLGMIVEKVTGFCGSCVEGVAASGGKIGTEGRGVRGVVRDTAAFCCEASSNWWIFYSIGSTVGCALATGRVWI